jgi:TonB family protein
MKGAADNFHHDVAAARAAASHGQRGEAEQWLRAALGHAETGAVPDGELATVLYELAALRRDEEDLGEAELLLQRGLEVLDGTPAPDDALLLHTLGALGSVLAVRGESARAEGLLARALAIGERVLGPEHAELSGLLNDLSRLHLKSGAHAAAEPLLLRLYDMKCATKGEDHPESATVLASLAMARQALGRHEDAEAMWRRVLSVREQTLAPNHFATATALERLAESCAARGKLSEAVQLLRRAVTMREITLGTSHPSVRVARDRIADLRLQASDGALEGFAPAERSLLLPMPVLPSVSSRAEASSAARPEPSTAPRVAPIVTPRTESAPTLRTESAPTLRTEPAPTPRTEPAPTPRAEPAPTPRAEFTPSVRAVATDGMPTTPASVVLPASSGALALHEPATRAANVPQSVYEGLMSIRAELASAGDVDEDDSDDEPIERRTAFGVSALTQLKSRRVPIIAAGAVSVLLLGGIVAMRSRAQDDLYASQYSTVQRQPSMATILPDSAAERRLAASPSPSTETAHLASAASAPEPHPPVSTQRRVVNGDVAPALRSTSAPTAPSVPVAPPKLLNNLGAIAGAVQAPAASLESSRTSPATDAPKSRIDLSIADGSNELVRAQLIGAAPVPNFPEILRDRKIVGDVIVRFKVDAQGRPDLSSFAVIRTPHELMSEAVRRVIPLLRFEPAHKARIGAPAEGDQVQMAFQFNGAKN